MADPAPRPDETAARAARRTVARVVAITLVTISLVTGVTVTVLYRHFNSNLNVVDITPDFVDEQYRVRAIDFDQQSYEGKIQAYQLDNTGQRIGPAKLEPMAGGEGTTLVIDAARAAFHWELVAE